MINYYKELRCRMKLDMERESVNSLLFRFSLPAVGGMIVSALYVIIDGIFIGKGIGSEGLAAINIAYPVITLGIAISLMLGVGGATVISVLQGQGEKKEAGRYLTYVIVLNILAYLVISFMTLTKTDYIVRLLGSSEGLVPLVKDYMVIGIIFSIFFMLSVSLNAVVRNDKAPCYAMFSMVLGAIVNIYLDWLFIFQMDMGMAGAALATGISQVISFLFLVGHFFRKKCSIRPEKVDIAFSYVKRIVANGFPSFILEFAVAIVTVSFNNVLMLYLGEIGVSAFSIIAYIFYIFRMIFTGLAQGIQPIVSYNFGAKKWARIKATLIVGHKIAFITAVLILICVYIGGEAMVKLFNGDEELIKIASRGLLFYSSAMIFLGANFINISYLQSMERSVTANILSVVRSMVFVLIGLISLPKIMGVDGVWLSLPFADLMTFGMGYIMTRREK